MIANKTKPALERIELVIAREYSSIPLQSTEQALHFIPSLVQLLVILPRFHATFQWWNNRREPHIERQSACLVARICAIHHQRRIPLLWPQPVEQFAPLRPIVGLARRERERYGCPIIRGNHMKLGGPSTSGLADGLWSVFLAAPVPSGCTLTEVLSSEATSMVTFTIPLR